jgi:hypothetical protein
MHAFRASHHFFVPGDEFIRVALELMLAMKPGERALSVRVHLAVAAHFGWVKYHPSH